MNANNQPLPTPESLHHLTPDYQYWGLAHTEPDSQQRQHVLAANTVSPKALTKIETHVKTLVDLEQFRLTRAAQVHLYQGNELPEAEAWLLRFAPKKQDGALNGEHTTVLFECSSGRLLGLTRMLQKLDNRVSASHQTVLNNCIKFMQQWAPELMPQNVHIPQLEILPGGQRYEQRPLPIRIGKVEMRWIDDHAERLIIEGQRIPVHGMKIKMYLPATQLWAWVIIDKTGNVMTFERNISWDFDQMQRNTQMWLHDAWLQTQEIHLPKLHAE